MTKYEWESELKKDIHRLPAEEIKRVLEYYDELFADMIERGKGEYEIIAEFGNPMDVAYKILSEYEVEPEGATGTGTVPSPMPPAREKEEGDGARIREESVAAETFSVPEIPLAAPEPIPSLAPTSGRESKDGESGGIRGGRLLLFVLLNIFTGFAFFIVAGAVWIVLGALVVSGGAMSVGGVAALIQSIGTLIGGQAASGLAQLGMSVALIGMGILVTVLMIAAIKTAAKLTGKFFVGLKNWLLAKRRTYEKD